MKKPSLNKFEKKNVDNIPNMGEGEKNKQKSPYFNSGLFKPRGGSTFFKITLRPHSKKT